MSLASLSKLDVFRFCRCCKLVGSAMIAFVTALVGLSWYTVFVVYSPEVHRGTLRAIGGITVIVAFSLLVVMLIWSYLATVLMDPGRVPAGWHPFVDEQQARHELQRMSYSDYYFDRRDPRRPRFCKRCQAWKPERAHHCSVLGRCVLRMDHMCVWTVNTIGLLNYKFFLLFLFYSLTSSLVAVLLLIKPLVQFIRKGANGHGAPFVFLTFVVDAAFVFSLAAFLVMHLQLVAANCTTIEMYEKDRIHPWPYNKGFRKNFEEVFGRHKWRWLLPWHTKEEKRLMLDACLNQRLLATPFGQPASSALLV